MLVTSQVACARLAILQKKLFGRVTQHRAGRGALLGGVRGRGGGWGMVAFMGSFLMHKTHWRSRVAETAKSSSFGLGTPRFGKYEKVSQRAGRFKSSEA